MIKPVFSIENPAQSLAFSQSSGGIYVNIPAVLASISLDISETIPCAKNKRGVKPSNTAEHSFSYCSRGWNIDDRGLHHNQVWARSLTHVLGIRHVHQYCSVQGRIPDRHFDNGICSNILVTKPHCVGGAIPLFDGNGRVHVGVDHILACHRHVEGCRIRACSPVSESTFPIAKIATDVGTARCNTAINGTFLPVHWLRTHEILTPAGFKTANISHFEEGLLCTDCRHVCGWRIHIAWAARELFYTFLSQTAGLTQNFNEKGIPPNASDVSVRI